MIWKWINLLSYEPQCPLNNFFTICSTRYHGKFLRMGNTEVPIKLRYFCFVLIQWKFSCLGWAYFSWNFWNHIRLKSARSRLCSILPACLQSNQFVNSQQTDCYNLVTSQILCFSPLLTLTFCVTLFIDLTTLFPIWVDFFVHA